MLPEAIGVFVVRWLLLPIVHCATLAAMVRDWLFLRHMEDDEELLCVIHKHWLVGLRFLFWPAAVFCGLVALLIAAYSLPVLYIVAALGVFTILWGVRNFLDYYLDAWMLTDTGLIDVAWHGWFHRESSRVLYSDIQGVSYEIQGMGGTFLRYGTVSVEKISTGSELVLEYVPHPRSVERRILRAMEDYMHSKNLKDATVVQELLSTVIARELHLRELQGDSDDDT